MLMIKSKVMKRWSTTPVSKGLVTKSAIVATAVVMAISAPLSMMPQASADKYDDRINALQNEIDQYQSEASQLNKKASGLQAELSKLNAEKAVIQRQIDINEAKHDQLKEQIEETERQIDDNKDALGITIADLYVDDTISPLEMLASSENIGDYVDKQTYRAAMSDQLAQTIDKINKLKDKLEKQQLSVKRTLLDQKNARNALAAKEAERGKILAETRGQESAYKKLASKREEEKLRVQQEQQAAIEAAMRAAGGGGPISVLPGDPSKGGYPWEGGCYVDANAVSHGGVDGNGGDPLGYGCRQCVSYAAWKMLQKTGYAPRYWGNANQWPASASNAGFSTGSTPRKGSLGVISAGKYGHIVYVEDVVGGDVIISQYNYLDAGGPGWGHYSKMRVSAATYDTYIYI